MLEVSSSAIGDIILEEMRASTGASIGQRLCHVFTSGGTHLPKEPDGCEPYHVLIA